MSLFQKQTYVIPLLLVPVEGLFGSVCAIAGGGLRYTIIRISATPIDWFISLRRELVWAEYIPPRDGGFANGNIGSGTGHLAAETIHVVCTMTSERSTRDAEAAGD